MVGVVVVKPGRDDDVRGETAQCANKLLAGGEVGLDIAVMRVEDLVFAQADELRRRAALAVATLCERLARHRLVSGVAIAHGDELDFVAHGDEFHRRCAHVEIRIVRMRSNADILHRWQVPLKSVVERCYLSTYLILIDT